MESAGTSRLSRIARALAERSGSEPRVDELLAHLDELEASGQQISPLDVGSIAVLVARRPVVDFSKSLATTYVAVIAAGALAWTIAAWTGLVASVEDSIEEIFALQEFKFAALGMFLLFAALAAPVVLAYVTAARLTVLQAYALTILTGTSLAAIAIISGIAHDFEGFASEIFALQDFQLPWLTMFVTFTVAAAPIVAVFVLFARTSTRWLRQLRSAAAVRS